MSYSPHPNDDVHLGPPCLTKDSIYRVVEGSSGFSLDLVCDPPLPFPPPTFHLWNKTSVDVLVNDSTITFDSMLSRKHTGMYSLTVANAYNGEEVGRDTGHFALDVLCKFTGYLVQSYVFGFHIYLPPPCKQMVLKCLRLWRRTSMSYWDIQW